MYVYIIYYIYNAIDVKSATHNIHTHVNISFGDEMYFGLRGEGRKNWEGME